MTFIIWATLSFFSFFLIERYAHWLMAGERVGQGFWLWALIPALLVGYTCSKLSLPHACTVFALCAVLTVTVITDLCYLLIHRSMTLCIVPIVVGVTAYAHGYPAAYMAVVGAAIGYGSLWIVKMVFLYLRGIDGLGQGDLDLGALIGACVGGAAFFTVCALAATSALAINLVAIQLGHMQSDAPIPFGAYLAGATLLVLCLS